MNKARIIAFVLTAIAVILFLIYLLAASNKEKNRFESNQTSLLKEVRIYKTSDSLNAASVEKLTLTNREFEKYNGNLVKSVESLNLKVRRLQSISQTATKAQYLVSTLVKDSLIYTSSIPDTIKCINLKDTWLKLSGCIQDKQFSGSIEIPDTLIQVVHRVPRKFLFVRYGTKAIRQEVLSLNPHTRIEYTKYIEFKR